MSESLRVTHESKLRMGAAAALLVLTGSSCGGETENEGRNVTEIETRTPESTSTINEAVEQALTALEQQRVDLNICRSVIDYDIDCDGVSDEYDKLPMRPDLGDDDGDLVTNVFDRYPNDNDLNYDTDFDGLVDAYDSFNGDNLGDSDGDGIFNGQDLQPLVPAQGNTYTDQDKRAAGNQIILNSMANESLQKILEIDPYVLPADTPFTTDSDGDNFNDYFDSEPSNPYITPDNNVYEIGSDAWYEDKDEY